MFLPNTLRQVVPALLMLLGCGVASIQAEEPKADPSLAKVQAVEEGILNQIYLNLNIAAQPNLGLEVTDPEPALRSQLDLPADQGLVVVSVAPGSPMANGGVRENDVLLTINDTAVGSADNFRLALTTLAAAEKKTQRQPVKMTLLRGGKKVTAEISTEIADANRLIGELQLSNSGDSQRYWIGVAVADIDGTLRAQLNLPEKQGLVVTEVKPESAAEKAGIKAHDVLLEFNETTLATTDDLRKVVLELGKDGKTGNLKLLRGGKPATLPVTPIEKKLEVAYVRIPNKTWANALLTAEQDKTEFNNIARVWKTPLALDYSFPVTLNPQTGDQQLGAITFGINPNLAQLRPAAPSDNQYKELLEAIQQLSKKIDALEQAIKK